MIGPGPSYISYYAEPLPGGRAQMQRDTVIDGRLVRELSGPDGSPASMETVLRHERRIELGGRQV